MHRIFKELCAFRTRPARVQMNRISGEFRSFGLEKKIITFFLESSVPSVPSVHVPSVRPVRPAPCRGSRATDVLPHRIKEDKRTGGFYFLLGPRWFVTVSTLLDLYVSSLRMGHANLRCLVRVRRCKLCCFANPRWTRNPAMNPEKYI